MNKVLQINTIVMLSKIMVLSQYVRLSLNRDIQIQVPENKYFL